MNILGKINRDALSLRKKFPMNAKMKRRNQKGKIERKVIKLPEKELNKWTINKKNHTSAITDMDVDK